MFELVVEKLNPVTLPFKESAALRREFFSVSYSLASVGMVCWSVLLTFQMDFCVPA